MRRCERTYTDRWYYRLELTALRKRGCYRGSWAAFEARVKELFG